MKVYYAHPMSWYGTDREKEDIATIQRTTPLSAEVVNPAKIEVDAADGPVMPIFLTEVAICDAIAYRTFDDDYIGAGVAQELLVAAIHGKQIFRIMDLGKNGTPILMEQDRLRAMFGPRVLTIAATRDRIKRGIM